MALGLPECMGQFFSKPLDKMMFLGELSLDGTLRSVRGALSARVRRSRARYPETPIIERAGGI